jgi:hypothetical protein
MTNVLIVVTSQSFICQPMQKLETHSGFRDLFINYNTIFMTFWSIVVDKCNIKMYPVYQPTYINMYIYDGKVSHMHWRMC